MPLRSPEPSRLDPVAFLVASVGGCGRAPVASGTVGSAVAAVLYWWTPLSSSPLLLLASILVAFLLGVPTATRMEIRHGKDPSLVVIDEVVGQWIALLLLPVNLPTLFAAFFSFRLFDILKPWPASFFDARTGGIHIMMDDVVAGVFANLFVQLALVLWSLFT